jgi:predicted lipid-binding transport protein (Tim44 family)
VRLPGSGNSPAAAAAELSPDRWKGVAELGSPVATGLDEILRIEPSFSVREFIEGAKMAYEMIVTAFAQGDRKTLKNLLAREVYEGFDRAIADREKRGEKAETTFVSIDRADLETVELRNRVAQITVRFLSKLITATRDAQGNIVDGSPEAVVDVTDVWTFARTLGTRDPNWQLVATESAQ